MLVIGCGTHPRAIRISRSLDETLVSRPLDVLIHYTRKLPPDGKNAHSCADVCVGVRLRRCIILLEGDW